MSIFPHIPSVKPPTANAIAEGLLRDIDREAYRRAGQHRDAYNAFWNSPEATPQQIADAMNGSAVLFFTIADANIKHLQSLASLVNKPLTDFLPEEYLTRPANVSPNADGSVTITPIEG